MSELTEDYLCQYAESLPDPRCVLADALTLATQRAEAAEAERESVSSQLWDCMNEREALRAERDALRTVDDAMVERAWKAIADVCGVISHDDDGRLLPTPHINIVEASDIRAALDAALAVQPTTGEGA